MTERPVELVLTRQLAELLMLPMALADANENLVFYNDAAASMLGQPFAEVGERSLQELAILFGACAADGTDMPAASVPLEVALDVVGCEADHVARRVGVVALHVAVRAQGDRRPGRAAAEHGEPGRIDCER